MKALSMVLVFAGYVLVYAAVAKQGAFATDPWAGIFADAYDDLPAIVTQEGQALGQGALAATSGNNGPTAQILQQGRALGQGL